MAIETRAARFDPGSIVFTKRAFAELNEDDVADALVRHLNGDWGNLDKFDWELNDEAVESGGRILSSFESLEGVTFWIITEADRTTTTFLLPEEY